MKITGTKIRDICTPDLRAKLAKAQNPKKALEAMGLAVVSLTKRAFTQASLRPANWAPLAKATIKTKVKAGYGTKPLISSGSLSHSPRVITVSAKTVSVGSDRRVGSHSLAGIHQFGTDHIPARPTWPFDEHGKPTEQAKRNVQAAARAALALERRA